jgi:anti-sigma B factor antagonist
VFEIDVQEDGALLVLRLRGDLDMAAVPAVEQTVERLPRDRDGMVVDIAELQFLDSTGLRLLLTLQQRQDGMPVAFTEPAPRVGRVLDITGVRRLLNWR